MSGDVLMCNTVKSLSHALQAEVGRHGYLIKFQLGQYHCAVYPQRIVGK